MKSDWFKDCSYEYWSGDGKWSVAFKFPNTALGSLAWMESGNFRKLSSGGYTGGPSDSSQILMELIDAIHDGLLK